MPQLDGDLEIVLLQDGSRHTTPFRTRIDGYMLGTADVALALLPLALAIVTLLGWGWWRCCSSSEGDNCSRAATHTDHRSLYFVSTIGFVSTSLRLWGWSAWMPYASLWLVREVGLDMFAVGWVLVTYNVGKLLAPVWGYFSGDRPGRGSHTPSRLRLTASVFWG